jgi:hypothetical protein
MTKPELLRALQTEIHRHTFDYFVENPPSMAEGGKGVVVPWKLLRHNKATGSLEIV